MEDAKNEKSRGFGSVSSPSDVLRSGDLFIFLAHDPRFGKDPDLYPPTDPEMVESKRALILTEFDTLGGQIAELRRKVRFYQDLAACEVWTSLELAKAFRGNKDAIPIIERVMIDRKVIQMDPHFSFSQAIYKEPMPSLLGQEHPT
jgi:hypothetical protein